MKITKVFRRLGVPLIVIFHSCGLCHRVALYICTFALLISRHEDVCVWSGGDWTASCSYGFTPRKEPLVSVGEETVIPKASLAAGCDRDMCQSLNLGAPFHSY